MVAGHMTSHTNIGTEDQRGRPYSPVSDWRVCIVGAGSIRPLTPFLRRWPVCDSVVYHFPRNIRSLL